MSVTFYHSKIKDYGNGVQQYINYVRSIKIGHTRTYSPPRDLNNELYDLLTEVQEEKKTMEEAEKIAQILIANSVKTKRSNNSRAKNKFYDIIQANEWEWFITLTFDPQKVNRQDYDLCCEKVKYFLDQTRRNTNANFRYCGVPEYHSDGISYHFHFLFSGLDPSYFKYSHAAGHDEIYNLPSYSVGFSTATKVRDTRKASGYLVKYMTKTISENLKGRKRYWASRNLNKVVEYTSEQNIDTSNFPDAVMTKIVDIDTVQYKNTITYEIFNFNKEDM